MPEGYGRLVDLEARTVSPEIFLDENIYRVEQEKIFGRSWLYLGHETQVPRPGDYVCGYMGEEPVILWRGGDGTIRAFINSCRHRGMKVCRVDAGNASRLTCPYHAWTYDSLGRLVGRAEQGRYPSDFDPGQWGLIPVPKVAAYGGFVFGCLDEQAVSLKDYLGEIGWYLDTQFRRTEKGRQLFPGVQKWTIDVNWKLISDQFAGDNYHAPIVHSSVGRLGFLGKPGQFAKAAPYEQDFEVRTAQGHGWINLTPAVPPDAPKEFEAYEATVRESARKHLSQKQADLTVTGAVGSVFPNFAFVSFLGSIGFRVWHPKGPRRSEIWLWTGADAEAPEWRKALSRDLNIRSFTAAGIFDQDDAEMWIGCQEALAGAYRRKFPLNFQLGATSGRRESERPGVIDSTPSEAGVFGFYERWKELMSS